jgi:DMSO/TMAO reductase YedYZ molybdopterin-dependent catalytic subunit
MKRDKPGPDVSELLGSVSFQKAAEAAAGHFVEKKLPTRTVEKKGFRFDPASGTVTWAGGRKEPYLLTVSGLVEEPATFSYRALQELPATSQVSDFHCVEGWSVLDVRWEGIRFEEIFKRIKARPAAKFALFHAMGETHYVAQGLNHYIESFPIADLVDPRKEILLVLKMNGEPLSREHGAPLRVVSPYDLAYKSIKYVARIEITEKAAEGWWTLANPIYPAVAPVPKERLRKK